MGIKKKKLFNLDQARAKKINITLKFPDSSLREKIKPKIDVK